MNPPRGPKEHTATVRVKAAKRAITFCKCGEACESVDGDVRYPASLRRPLASVERESVLLRRRLGPLHVSEHV